MGRFPKLMFIMSLGLLTMLTIRNFYGQDHFKLSVETKEGTILSNTIQKDSSKKDEATELLFYRIKDGQTSFYRLTPEKWEKDYSDQGRFNALIRLSKAFQGGPNGSTKVCYTGTRMDFLSTFFRERSQSYVSYINGIDVKLAEQSSEMALAVNYTWADQKARTANFSVFHCKQVFQTPVLGQVEGSIWIGGPVSPTQGRTIASSGPYFEHEY